MTTHAVATHGIGENGRSRRKKPARDRELKSADIVSVSESDLPPADTMTWSTKRKAIVVAVVQTGNLTLSEACARYRMLLEEFAL